jgi:hypothetical protein
MSRRVRKLIGLAVILAWLSSYALAIMSLAVRILPETGWINLAFYVVAGFAWILPLRPLLFWMERPDP